MMLQRQALGFARLDSLGVTEVHRNLMLTMELSLQQLSQPHWVRPSSPQFTNMTCCTYLWNPASHCLQHWLGSRNLGACSRSLAPHVLGSNCQHHQLEDFHLQAHICHKNAERITNSPMWHALGNFMTVWRSCHSTSSSSLQFLKLLPSDKNRTRTMDAFEKTQEM
jgi:hypothetical protein